MAKDFVVVYNPLHEGMADLARRSLLEPVYNYPNYPSLDVRTIEDIVHETLGIEKIIPAKYWESLDIPEFWGNGEPARTIQTIHDAGYFDANRVDPLCRDGLRRQLEARYASFFSFDLITYGVGVVRRVRAWSVGCGPVGKIEPKDYRAYLSILAKTHSDPDDNEKMHMEDWESTNIVFGDMYGGVLQIKDREKDKNFLNDLCEGLNQEPKSTFFWSPKIINLYQTHIDCQKLWDRPPISPEEIMERVDYILANSTLDKNPGFSIKRHPIFKDKQYVCATLTL